MPAIYIYIYIELQKSYYIMITARNVENLNSLVNKLDGYVYAFIEYLKQLAKKINVQYY